MVLPEPYTVIAGRAWRVVGDNETVAGRVYDERHVRDTDGRPEMYDTTNYEPKSKEPNHA